MIPALARSKEAGAPCAEDIHLDVVADVQHLMRGQCEARAGGVEDAGRRLRLAVLARTELEAEMHVQPDPSQVGIAVAQRGQRHACGKSLQCGRGVGIALDPVAFGEERLECRIRMHRIVATEPHRPRQRQPAHAAEVVGEVGALAVELFAQLAHGVDREPRRGARAMLQQPGVLRVLDPRADRRERPQGVIQIEGDGADGEAHLAILPPGWTPAFAE